MTGFTFRPLVTQARDWNAMPPTLRIPVVQCGLAGQLNSDAIRYEIEFGQKLSHGSQN